PDRAMRRAFVRPAPIPGSSAWPRSPPRAAGPKPLPVAVVGLAPGTCRRRRPFRVGAAVPVPTLVEWAELSGRLPEGQGEPVDGEPVDGRHASWSLVTRAPIGRTCRRVPTTPLLRYLHARRVSRVALECPFPSGGGRPIAWMRSGRAIRDTMP